MATNYYFRKDTQLEIIKTKISRTGHLAKGNYGCANSYADIIVKDCDKELIFPCGFEIAEYKFVNLTITKGILGFDIIMGKEPSTE